jgi:Tfp pilus assembly protein PilO
VKRNELMIFGSLAVIGLVVGFWLVLISPKRQEAASLKVDIDQLHSSLEQAQQEATAGQEAQKSFPVDYRRLVVLGKAVPQDGEQASLLVQLQTLADRSDVRFQSIDLSQSGGSVPASSSSSTPSTSTSTGSTATPTSSTPPSSGASSSSSSASSASTSSSSAPAPEPTAAATEASAASLPIGASVGPAGLPVMPYDLKFTGNYFQIADFLKRVDGLVHTRGGQVDVRGRLLTVDAFSLQPVQSETGGAGSVPTLTAGLAVTTYLTPSDQGITAGATPTGPTPATPTPVAGTSTSATSTPTSTSGPVPAAPGPSATSP